MYTLIRLYLHTCINVYNDNIKFTQIPLQSQHKKVAQIAGFNSLIFIKNRRKHPTKTFSAAVSVKKRLYN